MVKEYPVSTSVLGAGNKEGSEKTPLGRHRIKKKIGQGQALGAMFENKKPLGKISPIFSDKFQDPGIDDHILLPGF